MANLGTLWFGADIDLTQLKQKVNQGNKDILDALKLNYDPASYQQMVSRLKSELLKETFEINISTNAQKVRQELSQTLNTISNNGSIPNVNLNALKGINGMTREILNQRDAILDNKKQVQYYKEEWGKAINQFGRRSSQAMAAFSVYDRARTDLRKANWELEQMNINRGKASLSQKVLNEQMKEAQRTAKQWSTDHMRLNATLAGGIHISTQLGSALSSLFAIDAARQFLGQVIEIGGQLEKQRISIGAILGDIAKANHLFEQIKGLALKSPFGVVELDQYTKQLSAYGFKYSELFDMTKRLADISAGAGTDIGRLTLALGHVRSATYLTGITLRQFSMNNIPMLKMLADYYTEIEKKVVSTAEVQKRISKRQVSYEDVIEQIRRLTDEGGMFFNMQEKISESLAAKYKNLRDAMDIMYGEMAEGSVGDALKYLASVLLKVTRHWKEIGSVMMAATVSFLVSKTRIGMATLTMQGNTAATLKQIMATKQLEANNLRAAATYRVLTAEERIKIASSKTLTAQDVIQAMATKELTKDEVLNAIALKKLSAAEAQALVQTEILTQAEVNAALATNKWTARLSVLGAKMKTAFSGFGYGTWATIGFMVGAEIYSAYNSWVERIEDRSKEMQDVIKSRIIDLKKQQNILSDGGKPNNDAEMKARITDMKQVLANSEAYTKTLDEQLSKASGLPEQYDILAEAIGKAAEKNRQMFDYQDAIAEMIKGSTGDFMSTNFSENLRWFFDDDITKNMEQTLDAYKDLRNVIDSAWEYKDAIKGLIDEMIKSGSVSEDFAEQLKNAPFEEQIRLLAESGYWEVITNKILKNDKDFLKFAQNIKESTDGVNERWLEIANNDIPKMFQKLSQIRSESEDETKRWALNNIEDFKLMMEGILDQLEVKEPAIRRILKRIAYNYVSFSSLLAASDGTVTADQYAQVYEDTLNTIRKSDENLKRLLEEDENVPIKEDNLTGETNPKGDKKDAQLEAAKTKLQQYKAFLSEYKKFREMYSKEKAINLLEALFPDLKDSKGNFLGKRLVDDYLGVLGELRSSLKLTTEARKKWANDVDKTKSDAMFDREKEAMKENVDAMTEYIKRMEDQWKLYRSLMKKSGGNKEFAAMAFGTNGMIWDEAAKEMLNRFNERGKELGVVPMAFHWNMNEKEMKESLVNAKGQVQEELVKLAQDIQKVVRGNYTQFLEDSAEAYQKSLSASQKLTELEQQRRDIIKKRDEDNDLSDEKRKGYAAQIAALDRQIAGQRWDAFKETEQWGRVFGNLDNLTTQTLENLLTKLQEVAPTINDDVESVKALYEAIEKIKNALIDRNPFSIIGDTASDIEKLRKYSQQAGTQGNLLANKDLSRLLRVPLGSEVSKSQIDDALKEAMGRLGPILGSMAKKFKAVEDVLSPVIDLFERLGNTTLSSIFSAGSNALGAAAQVAGGLNALGLESLGPYGAAIGAGLSLVSSVFAMQDEALQEEIEASQARQKEMENLTKNLEKVLERTLGGVYNTKASQEDRNKLLLYVARNNFGKNLSQFLGGNMYGYLGDDTLKAIGRALETETYYDTKLAELMLQRDEVKKQMQAESNKKDSDDSAIADYEQQITELDDQIKNFALDMANALYSIDLKSWAKDLSDAVVEAWENGEDAAEAYTNKVKDLMKDLTKNILAQKVIEEAFKAAGIDTLISDMMNKTSGQLDYGSVSEIADALFKIGEASADAITAVLDEMEKKGYISKGDGTSKTSSKVIQGGFTENETGLLISYVNTIRADLSIQRVDVAAIRLAIESFAGRGMLTVTQERNLQNIADNTKRNADAADNILSLLTRATIDKAFGFKVQ